MAWNGNNGKNTSDTLTEKRPADGGTRKIPSIMRGGVAAFLVVVLAAGVWWCLAHCSGKQEQNDSSPSTRKAMKEKENPVPHIHKKTAVPANEVSAPHSNIPPEQQVMHTNLYGYVINRPHTAVVITNKHDDADKSLEERVFTNSADQKIAGLLMLEPGELLVGDASSLFGRGFTRAFLKSLESPIIITKDDDETTAELKRAVRDTKVEIKARFDAGEDIAELMAKERDELQAIGLYRKELENEIRKIARDDTISESDMADFVKAANLMLQERGGKPLEMPRFAARRFKLERIRKGIHDED